MGFFIMQFSRGDILATDLKKHISAGSNFILFFVVNVQVSDLYVKTGNAIVIEFHLCLSCFVFFLCFNKPPPPPLPIRVQNNSEVVFLTRTSSSWNYRPVGRP
jgi:hypothetical protein